MVEDLKTIYEGKATILKNKSYFSAQDYIKPFVEKVSGYTDKFICEVKVADQLSAEDDTVNTVYNRVLITAVFPEEYDFVIDKVPYHRVVCMALGLDVKTPICKFYTGVMDHNAVFYAFGGDCMSIQKVEPETALDYTPIQTIIDNGFKDQCQVMITQMQDLRIPESLLKNKLGEWLDFAMTKEYFNDSGKIKLPTNMALEAYKNITIEKGSDFYSEETLKHLQPIYKAFSSQIGSDDKDLLNRYEKIQLVNQMFGF